MVRRILVSATLVLLVAGLVPPSAQAGERSRYIVVLKSSVGDPGTVARQHASSNGARIGHVYTHAIKGYSASMTDVAAAKVANDNRVSYVEPDGVVHKTAVTQPDPVWGLDRIDERERDDVSSYTYDYTGSGVTAYVIDTGIWPSHTDFGGRVGSGYDFVDKDENTTDCDGHGTHVAGTIGGNVYGVAKQVRLVGVRVLNCSGSGSWSNVIAGVDWVTKTATQTGAQRAVANMSLGGGANSAVDDAVTASVEAGITYAVSAGNGNQGGKAQDACGNSPARTPAALTVGATNSSDTKASWSNYGTCVDLFAPGVGITSTTMDGLTGTWSGTSMSAPHVAGVAALYLEGAPSASAHQVADAINLQSTKNLVENEGPGSPDRLLYSRWTESEPSLEDPPDPAPSVAITSPGAGSTVTGAVAVTAEASDTSPGSVARVEFYADTVAEESLIGVADINGSDGWSESWDSTAVGDGAHSLIAVATDDAGGTATDSVSVTVDNIEDTTTAFSSVTVTRGDVAKKGPWFHIPLTVAAADATGAVSGATVVLDVLGGACPGSSLVASGSGTTGSDGSVTFTFKTRTADDHCAAATVTKDGYDPGGGSTTFNAS